jgi:hypothetical protein
MGTKTNLFQLLTGLRHFGVGAKVQREIHRLKPNTHFVVEKVELGPDQLHGKVWGRFIWRGRPRETTELIGSPLKREWTVVQLPHYGHFSGRPEEVAKIIAASASAAGAADAGAGKQAAS